MTPERLQEIEQLCDDFKFRYGEPSAAIEGYEAVRELIAEVLRLTSALAISEGFGMAMERIAHEVNGELKRYQGKYPRP